MNIYSPRLAKYLAALQASRDQSDPSDDLKIVDIPLTPDELKEDARDKAA